MAVGGLGPSEPVDAKVSLETNGPDGDGIVTVSSMDAEVVAHVVLLNDLEQGLDMVGVLGLERGLVPDVAKAVVPGPRCCEGRCTCNPVSQHIRSHKVGNGASVGRT